MRRRQRMLWAATMAMGMAAFVGLGAVWLQGASSAALAAPPTDGAEAAGEHDRLLPMQDLAAQAAREDTCARFECSATEADDGLTFTVHR